MPYNAPQSAASGTMQCTARSAWELRWVGILSIFFFSVVIILFVSGFVPTGDPVVAAIGHRVTYLGMPNYFHFIY